jgi:hypothetical protein
MLTAEQLKRFSNHCLKLRQTLQNGMRCDEFEYLAIKSQIHTLMIDLETQIEKERASADNPQTTLSPAT